MKEIGQKFETVSKEYADIRDSVSKIEVQIGKISNEIPDKVRGILRDESENERSKLLSRAGLILLGLLGLAMTAISNEWFFNFIKSNVGIIGLVIIVIAVALFSWINKRK